MVNQRWKIVLVIYAVVVAGTAFTPVSSDFIGKPLAMVGAWASILMSVRCSHAPRYYSGIILQMAILLGASIFVFFCSYGVANIVLCYLIWAFALQPNLLITKAGRCLLRGDSNAALATAVRLRRYWWGTQSEFFLESIRFSIAVNDEQWQTAESILNKWRGNYAIPATEQSRVCGMEADLYAQQHNWPRVIELYAIDSLKEPTHASVAVLLNAVRAYAETGHFEESVNVMEKLRVEMLVSDLAIITRVWLGRVAAFGDMEHLENLFDGVESTPDQLNDFEKNVLRARALLTHGKLAEAKNLLSLCQKQIVALPDEQQIAPKAKSVVCEIHYIDKLLSNNYAGPLVLPTAEQLDRVRSTWSRIRAHAVKTV